MKCKILALNASRIGNGIVLTIGIGKQYEEQVGKLVKRFNGQKEYEIKELARKRSLNSNAYAWFLCDAIAQKLGTTKEAVYRQAVGDVGVYEHLLFADTPTKTAAEAMKDFKKKWYSNGVGWLTKTIDDKTLHAYYGSSTYSKEEMARLIDWLVDQAQEQGVPTMSDDELKLMIGRWKE